MQPLEKSFALLGLTKGATITEVKNAYRSNMKSFYLT
jgi:curved DNA-binding protein CbpA